MSRFQITKNYSPENGFTATFRQWRADSHCRFIHGYALGVRITLECGDCDLDENGWVFNFGGLKTFKAWLAETFDHKTLVAEDDPALPLFREMAKIREEKRHDELKTDWDEAGQLIQLVVVPRTGAEGFAKMVGEWLIENILDNKDTPMFDRPCNRGVMLVSVEVYEHTGNSAIWRPSNVLFG